MFPEMVSRNFNWNLPPGTVVDTIVVHLTEFASIFSATMERLGQANLRTIMSYMMNIGLVLTRSRSLYITYVSPLLGVQNLCHWSCQYIMLILPPIEEGCTMMQCRLRKHLEFGLMRGLTVSVVLWRI